MVLTVIAIVVVTESSIMVAPSGACKGDGVNWTWLSFKQIVSG